MKDIDCIYCIYCIYLKEDNNKRTTSKKSIINNQVMLESIQIHACLHPGHLNEKIMHPKKNLYGGIIQMPQPYRKKLTIVSVKGS